MELKAKKGTAVMITTVEELDEFTQILRDAGWSDFGLDSGFKRYGSSFYATVDKKTTYGNIESNPYDHVLITLAQFKERNGIMKYKEGDVLVSGNEERMVLGVHRYLYHMSSTGFFNETGRDYSEDELNNNNYTLKTDEPEMVELTLEDVAKLKGIPVETLRIKD